MWKELNNVTMGVRVDAQIAKSKEVINVQEGCTAPLYVFQFVETASLLLRSNVTTKTIPDASIVR